MQVYQINFNTGKLEPAQVENLKTGQIVWLNGYDQSKYRHERMAIYDSYESGGHIYYKTVNLENFTFHTLQGYGIKPDSKIFGIGYYYTENDFANSEEIAAALEKANVKKAERAVAEATAEAEKNQLQQIGKELFKKLCPAWAHSVIIAEYVRDNCDSMTDYYNTVAEKFVILAWSKHGRDNFAEMRKAAGSFAETQHLEKAGAAIEHREKYSGGAGYYLKAGSRYSSGWEVSKLPLADYTFQKIYKALATGNYKG